MYANQRSSTVLWGWPQGRSSEERENGVWAKGGKLDDLGTHIQWAPEVGAERYCRGESAAGILMVFANFCQEQAECDKPVFCLSFSFFFYSCRVPWPSVLAFFSPHTLTAQPLAALALLLPEPPPLYQQVHQETTGFPWQRGDSWKMATKCSCPSFDIDSGTDRTDNGQ